MANTAYLLNGEHDVTYLDRVLRDGQGRLRPVPGAELTRVPHAHLQLWCHHAGVYGVPTLELIEAFRERIGGRSAIEIGAGVGVFGRELGIPMTDSHAMDRPEVRELYAALQQPTTPYGPDVENLDAAAAVAKYRPQVVLGSWITQCASPNLPPPPGGGSVYGVDEFAMMEHVETYLLFGNDAVHAQKDLFRCGLFRVKVLRSTAFYSRARFPEQNALYVVTRA